MTSSAAGAPIEADAILLAIQPHRDDDLFVRALVRGLGVVGLHVAHGQKPGRKNAGALQPFALGHLQADGRRILRRLDPLPALGASRLAREPVRYWCAHVLAEVALPLLHDGSDAPFDDLWRDFLLLHARAELEPTGFLADALGGLLRSAGVLAVPGACANCGADLLAAGALAELSADGVFQCAACARDAGAPWTPSLLARLCGEAPDDPSTALGAGERGVPREALAELVRVAEAFLGRPLLAWRDAGDWLR